MTPKTLTVLPRAGSCTPGTGPSATSMRDVRLAEPSKNGAMKAKRTQWWQVAVRGINAHPLYQPLLGFRVNKTQHRTVPGLRGRKVCRRVLAKTSAAEQSHKWQDTSGNTDGYTEPKRAPSLLALGIFGMPEREVQIPTPTTGTPVSHACLIWGLQSTRGDKIKCRTFKLFGKIFLESFHIL